MPFVTDPNLSRHRLVSALSDDGHAARAAVQKRLHQLGIKTSVEIHNVFNDRVSNLKWYVYRF